MIDLPLETLIRFDDARPAVIPVADSGHARILLVCLREGQVVKDHRSASQVMIQCLKGRAGVFTDGVPKEIVPGVLMLIEPNRFHRLEAREESVLLVVMTPHPSREGSVLLVVMTPHPSREGYPREQLDRIILRGGPQGS